MCFRLCGLSGLVGGDESGADHRFEPCGDIRRRRFGLAAQPGGSRLKLRGMEPRQLGIGPPRQSKTEPAHQRKNRCEARRQKAVAAAFEEQGGAALIEFDHHDAFRVIADRAEGRGVADNFDQYRRVEGKWLFSRVDVSFKFLVPFQEPWTPLVKA